MSEPDEAAAERAVAYKILTLGQLAQWQADGHFAGAPVDLADGFIHLSAADQVQGTLAKHFAGQSDLLLVAVDLDALGASVKWEVSRGGAHFPHVYGAMPLSCIVAVAPIDSDGAALADLGGV